MQSLICSWRFEVGSEGVSESAPKAGFDSRTARLSFPFYL